MHNTGQQEEAPYSLVEEVGVFPLTPFCCMAHQVNKSHQ